MLLRLIKYLRAIEMSSAICNLKLLCSKAVVRPRLVNAARERHIMGLGAEWAPHEVLVEARR
jgi:hypothetical protein